MATFLELVNQVERDSGIDVRFNATADVTAAPTLRQQKIVEWTAEAWKKIQNSRNDWRFMRGEFTYALVTDQLRYTPAQLDLTDHSQWPEQMDEGFEHFTVHDPAVGAGDMQILRRKFWQEWRERWGRNDPPASRPIDWSIDLDNKLCVGPKPDRAWVLTGEYIRTPQILAANDDVPRCPPQFHDAIVYRALMLVGDHDEAATVIVPAKSKFDAEMRAMVNATTEQVTF